MEAAEEARMEKPEEARMEKPEEARIEKTAKTMLSEILNEVTGALTLRMLSEKNDALITIGKAKTKRKFAYFVGRNIEVLKPFMKAIGRMEEPKEEYKEAMVGFEERRIQLCQTYAEKTSEGKPIMMGTKYLILKPEFKDALNKLRNESEFKEAVDDFDEQKKETEKILDEPLEAQDLERVKFYRLQNWKHVPKSIEGVLLSPLLDMIEGELPDDLDDEE